MTVSQEHLEQQINDLFAMETLPANALVVVEQVIDALDDGSITVVEKAASTQWHVNVWVKKAILLYFRLRPTEQIESGPFFDKVPLKTLSPATHRIVPFSSIRKGAFIAPKVVVMAPSFINIGAYIDEGSMVDSLVLVGSCARIGKNVHIGAGTIVGGVLEPPNSQPVIIEDGAFIGGNCGIYEGCLVESNAVVAAGTIITGGTPIIDISTGEEFFGRVPKNAVVVPGGRLKTSAHTDSSFVLQTPLIIKKRDPRVSAKVALEDSLRSFG
ncbi:MAG: 2,3,4,5-tetrahydropyridine-2,6-dicarboxylate N-succinyltransferase [Candidatus Melainabacteria bacterium]|nr:2,3,4,5-tetrahydropyridine-2,6-dicarboxylate N-succinyltransferase [Candidatus Melainabacteria bacterium]